MLIIVTFPSLLHFHHCSRGRTSAGEQRWQQIDDLYRASCRPRQGGAVAKSQQSAYGGKDAGTAKLFVGSRYQAQVGEVVSHWYLDS